MHVNEVPLKSLSSIELTKEETALLKWIRDVSWEESKNPQGVVMCKAKVPEFYGGARLYRMVAGGASAGSLGPLELLVRKLSVQGVIGKQGLYPIEGHGSQPRTLTLKKADLNNLLSSDEDEEE